MAGPTFHESFSKFLASPYHCANFTFFGGQVFVSFDSDSPQATGIQEADFLDPLLDYCIEHNVRIIFNDNSITLEKR